MDQSPAFQLSYEEVWVAHMGGAERAARETLAAYDSKVPPLWDMQKEPPLAPGESFIFGDDAESAALVARMNSRPTISHSDRVGRRLAVQTLYQYRAGRGESVLLDVVRALAIEMGLVSLSRRAAVGRTLALAEGRAKGTVTDIVEAVSSRLGIGRSTLWAMRGQRDYRERVARLAGKELDVGLLSHVVRDQLRARPTDRAARLRLLQLMASCDRQRLAVPEAVLEALDLALGLNPRTIATTPLGGITLRREFLTAVAIETRADRPLPTEALAERMAEAGFDQPGIDSLREWRASSIYQTALRLAS